MLPHSGLHGWCWLQMAEASATLRASSGLLVALHIFLIICRACPRACRHGSWRRRCRRMAAAQPCRLRHSRCWVAPATPWVSSMMHIASTNRQDA